MPPVPLLEPGSHTGPEFLSDVDRDQNDLGAVEGQSTSTLAQLNGTWRLLYSSGFATGSLGGRNPGPPVALLPFSIGQARVSPPI